MHVTREGIVGVSVSMAFLAGVTALAAQSTSPSMHAFAWLAGLGSAGAVGVFAALATHLASAPAAYEPLEGGSSAWGLAEFDESTGKPKGDP